MQTRKIPNKLQRLLSYVFPITLLKRKTKFQEIYVQLVEGKIQLNTNKANYSFGENHEAWEKILKIVKPSDNILILGFGGGTIATLLSNYNIKKITGIEIDAELLEIYNKYFSIKDENIKIITADAFKFVKDDNNYYDFILIDLFFEIYLPEELITENFLNNLMSLLRKGGKIVVNTLILDKKSRKQNYEFRKLLSEINLSWESYYIDKHEFFVLTK